MKAVVMNQSLRQLSGCAGYTVYEFSLFSFDTNADFAVTSYAKMLQVDYEVN